MFRLTIPDHLTLPVTVRFPDGGEGDCTIDVRYLGQQARADYLKRITDESLTDTQILDDLLVEWDGITNEEGGVMNFKNNTARRQVLDVPWVYEAIRDAVLREIGLAAASEKNS